MTVHAKFENLTGKLLIATPLFAAGTYFEKKVIYIFRHTAKGIMGAIINQPVTQENGSIVIKQTSKRVTMHSIEAYIGGPIDEDLGLILYTERDAGKNNINVSFDVNVLKEILEGKGPKQKLLLFGYCAWMNRQLEEEIIHNSWILRDAYKELVFETKDTEKWHEALKSLNINPACYAMRSGVC
jgi:putative transcriptional regulator